MKSRVNKASLIKNTLDSELDVIDEDEEPLTNEDFAREYNSTSRCESKKKQTRIVENNSIDFQNQRAGSSSKNIVFVPKSWLIKHSHLKNKNIRITLNRSMSKEDKYRDTATNFYPKHREGNLRDSMIICENEPTSFIPKFELKDPTQNLRIKRRK
jgi:hypothetical protein